MKKRACFYNSSVLYIQGNLGKAMGDALDAYEIAKDEGDPYWIAKTAELMADIFTAAYNYEGSEAWNIMAAEYYKKSGKELNHRYALCDLASTYLNENKDSAGTAILDSLSNVIIREDPVDPALLDYVMAAKCASLVYDGKFDEINDDILSHLHEESNEDVVNYSILKSYILNWGRQPEASLNLLSEALEYASDKKQSIRIKYAIYKQALAMEDYRKAATMADSLLKTQSDIAREILKESVTGAQRDFYSSKARQQQVKARTLSFGLLTVIVSASIIIGLLIVIYRLKIKAKQNELDINISSLTSIREKIETVSKENERLSAEIAEKSVMLDDLLKKLNDSADKDMQNRTVIEFLFREKWKTLNMLCNEYFELGESEVTRKALLGRIESEISKLSSKKSLRNIETAVNLYMGGIMRTVREECTFLKEEDIVFISLIIAGLSVRAVCMFLGLKYKFYYLKKGRLVTRISSSSAPHKEAILDKLK